MASRKERLTRRGLEVLESDSLGYPDSIRLIDIDRHRQNPETDSTHIYVSEFDSRGNLLELKSEDDSADVITFRNKNVKHTSDSSAKRKEMNPDRLELLGIAVDPDSSPYVLPSYR